MHRRLLILLFVFCGTTGVLTTTLVAGEANSTTIKEAQKEFKALDSIQSLPGDNMKMDLPKLSGPDTGEVIPYISPLQRVKDAEKKKANHQSENWLVDAMMKTDKSTSRNGRDDDTDKNGESLDPFEQLIREQSLDPKVENRALGDEEELKAGLKDAAINPLNKFMSSWISSRDQELLLRDMAAPDTVLSVSRFSDVGAPGNVFNPRGEVSVFSLGSETSEPNVLRRVDNPYLDLSGQGEFVPAKRAPLIQLAPEKVASPPAQMIPVPVTTKRDSKDLKPPGLANPEEDARYFPQLKRF